MPDTAPVTLLIGHFEDLLARGLRGLVEDDASLEMLVSDVRPAALPTLLRSRRPRVAIIDYASLGSPAEVRALAAAHPATQFVLLVDHLSGAESAQLLAFGAAACLSRATQTRDVLNAIHLASRGIQLAPRELHGGPLDPGVLTPREADILAELQRRRANAQIASDLHISVETVRTHARNIYRKLGVSSRRELLTPTRPDAGGGGADGAGADGAGTAAAGADDARLSRG
jgi:DNA-binding NarL/FixJ family response regulator